MSGALRHRLATRGTAPWRAHADRAAARLCGCGVPFLVTDHRTGQHRVVWRTCMLPLLCPECAELRAAVFARADFARVALLRRKHPGFRLAFVTTKPGEAEDLRGQVLALFELHRALLRLDTEPFNKVRAAALQVHPERGRRGGWRAHVHGIVAVDYPRAGLEEWFATGAKSATSRRALSEHLGGAIKWHVAKFLHATCSDMALLERLWKTPEWEAYRRSAYSARVPILTVVDSLHAFEKLFRVNLRRTYGGFRGASADTLRACWEEAQRAHVASLAGPEPRPQYGKGIDSGEALPKVPQESDLPRMEEEEGPGSRRAGGAPASTARTPRGRSTGAAEPPRSVARHQDEDPRQRPGESGYWLMSMVHRLPQLRRRG